MQTLSSPTKQVLLDLATQHAVNNQFQCLSCLEKSTHGPALSYTAGWEARDQHLYGCLFGDTPAHDITEIAMKAYGAGHADGSGDNETIYNEFEAFAQFVRDSSPQFSQLHDAATNMLEVMRASKPA